MIAGMITPETGEVLVDGERLSGDTDPKKRRIGLVPQDLALYDELSARANLRFFGALYSLAGAALDTAIASALELVGLADRVNDRVATMIVPVRWAVDGLDAMTWRGIGFSGALVPMLVLVGFAALFAAIAATRFRWEEA